MFSLGVHTHESTKFESQYFISAFIFALAELVLAVHIKFSEKVC